MIRDLINWSLQALLADALGKETLVEASNVVSNAVHRIFFLFLRKFLDLRT